MIDYRAEPGGSRQCATNNTPTTVPHMACCCPAAEKEPPAPSAAKRDVKSLAAPSQQSMGGRGGDEGAASDAYAVEWWRSRSTDSSQNNNLQRSASSQMAQARQLSAEAEQAWADRSRMATVESIEVDELSAVQALSWQQRQRAEDASSMGTPVPFSVATNARRTAPVIQRTLTEEQSAATDESPLKLRFVQDLVDPGMSPPDSPQSSNIMNDYVSAPPPARLRDLRRNSPNMMNHVTAEDYLQAAASADEIDLSRRGADTTSDVAVSDVTVNSEGAEARRMEKILTLGGRSNPTTVPTTEFLHTATTASPHRRAPPSPHRPPTPQEARAAAAAAAAHIQMRDVDALSNVPSAIDAETRDRYLLACRLLKATMIEKDSRLHSSDQEFLRTLLSTADQPHGPSAHDLDALETASSVLLSDAAPLGRDGSFSLSSIKEAWQRKAQELFASRPTGLPGVHLPVPQSSSSAGRPRSLDLPVLPERTGSRPRPRPFVVLGKKRSGPPGVLTQPLMEALRGFMPQVAAEQNFWLRFSLTEHGGTLPSLLSRLQNCQHTVIGIETKGGNVFGAYCSSPWKVQPSWFGATESFLWRLKQSRLAGGGSLRNYEHDNEMEVYPYTGHDEQIQYCTERTMAVGGGEWSMTNGIVEGSPHVNEPTGIAFMVDGDLMGGETNSSATFANPRLCGNETGGSEFDIAALEVWTLTPSQSILDAQRLEGKRAMVAKTVIRQS